MLRVFFLLKKQHIEKQTRTFLGQIFANYRISIIEFQEIRENFSHEKYFLPQFAKINPREKLEIGQFAKLNPREKISNIFLKKSLLHCLLSHPILKEQASFR